MLDSKALCQQLRVVPQRCCNKVLFENCTHKWCANTFSRLQSIWKQTIPNFTAQILLGIYTVKDCEEQARGNDSSGRPARMERERWLGAPLPGSVRANARYSDCGQICVPKQGGPARIDSAHGFEEAQKRKVDRYERLAIDIEEKWFSVWNCPLEVGCRGVIAARNCGVLATLATMCKVKDFKIFRRTLGKIALLGSHRIWISRKSQAFVGGNFILP